MKTIKILFADDDLKYSMLLKRFLETEGYEVTYAGNGNIALQQFPLIKPDLVLLDINMPELNGFEVAAKIRKQNHQVLIFFLSDRSDKADRLKGFDLQANDYLAKPFYPEELLARIRERFQCVDNRIETEIYTFGKSTFNYTTNEIRTGNNKVLITSRQAEILRILAKNLHVPVDREILLKHVWGASSYANSLALNVQITYLRKALRNDSSVKIESLMKKGYVLHIEKDKKTLYSSSFFISFRMTNYKEYQIAESTLFYNVQVPSTSLPIAHTARIFKSWSRIKISASFPFCKEPLRSYTPINFEGVSEAIRTASSKGISAFCTKVRIKRSMVATLPANAERSASLHTPSSMMTRGSKATLLSLAAHAKASVMTQARSTPFIL